MVPNGSLNMVAQGEVHTMFGKSLLTKSLQQTVKFLNPTGITDMLETLLKA